jgi:hypothetical protein
VRRSGRGSTFAAFAELEFSHTPKLRQKTAKEKPDKLFERA